MDFLVTLATVSAAACYGAHATRPPRAFRVLSGLLFSETNRACLIFSAVFRVRVRYRCIHSLTQLARYLSYYFYCLRPATCDRRPETCDTPVSLARRNTLLLVLANHRKKTFINAACAFTIYIVFLPVMYVRVFHIRSIYCIPIDIQHTPARRQTLVVVSALILYPSVRYIGPLCGHKLLL